MRIENFKGDLYLNCNKSGICCKGTIFLTTEEFFKFSDRIIIGASAAVSPLPVPYGYRYKFLGKDVWVILHFAVNGVYPTGVCPFLKEDGLCEVYEERPLMCRAYPLRMEAINGRKHYYIFEDFCQNCKGENCFSKVKGEELLIKNGNIDKQKKKILNDMKRDIRHQYKLFFERFFKKQARKEPEMIDYIVFNTIQERLKGNDTFVDIFASGIFYELMDYMKRKNIDVKKFLENQERLRRQSNDPLVLHSLEYIEKIKERL